MHCPSIWPAIAIYNLCNKKKTLSFLFYAFYSLNITLLNADFFELLRHYSVKNSVCIHNTYVMVNNYTFSEQLLDLTKKIDR